ncbi:hypothetical protein K3495_g9478 [Podosphaera aphanis]|nr:hypothetical protein K3495_g9478 [Podosphaera aphanis]
MRSFTYASVLALVLSVSAFPSEILSTRPDHLETFESSLEVRSLSDGLEKRHYHAETKYVEIGYTCGTKFYSSKHIKKTVQRACKKIDSKKLIKSKYPKLYSPKDPAGEFHNLRGNQYESPILNKHIYSSRRRAHHHRVVFNRDCKVAGLVKQKKNRSWKTLGLGGKISYEKCTKVFKNMQL